MRYTKFKTEILEDNPHVSSVTSDKIAFTYDYRVELFNAWKKIPTTKTLKIELEKIGILPEYIPDCTYIEIQQSFKTSGFPLLDRYEYESDTDRPEENPLILSGKFHYRNTTRWGISIDTSFKEEIMRKYPEMSIRESLANAGLDLLDVGRSRIYQLEREAIRRGTESISDIGNIDKEEKDNNTLKDMRTVTGNPYIVIDSDGTLSLRDEFYDEVCLIERAGLDSLLKMYGIPASAFSQKEKTLISIRIKHWTLTENRNSTTDLITGRTNEIQIRRMKTMAAIIDINFKEIGECFWRAATEGRRRICRWIDRLPQDKNHIYSRKHILELTGISKSIYYELLNNEDYGSSFRRKADRDEKDIEVIRQVLKYKGFEKGIRQVYMLMPKVTGQHFSIYRIRRLMNKYGIRTTIRHPSRNRKAMKELIARNRKANLLLQKFRMHRPNEVRLTDVTYLDYGEDKRAYGSASVDPVTGRLICFIVSETNDLQLALDTLEAMDSYPARSGAILHSDQGILYMTDDFQAAVVERELVQSMSRRGNCWDNAPQESFFGHFKDESHYADSRTLEELRCRIDEYSVYYNHERGMWDKERMTPIEYERYLTEMDAESFQAYMAKEEQKYLEMKRRSAEKAVQRAKENKEFIEEQLEEVLNETGG